MPDLPEVAGEVVIPPQLVVRLKFCLRIQLVRYRLKPSRLDEADQVARDGHAHFVPPAHQFTPDGDAGLDLTASSIA